MKTIMLSFKVTDKFAASTNFKEIIDSINNNYAVDDFDLNIDYKKANPETFQKEKSDDQSN